MCHPAASGGRWLGSNGIRKLERHSLDMASLGTAALRLARDLKELYDNPLQGVIAEPLESDILQWRVSFNVHHM